MCQGICSSNSHFWHRNRFHWPYRRPVVSSKLVVSWILNLSCAKSLVHPSHVQTSKQLLQDWELADRCVSDGLAPAYMKANPNTWMFSSLYDCCKAHYSWEDAYGPCIVAGGGSLSTQVPVGGEGWCKCSLPIVRMSCNFCLTLYFLFLPKMSIGRVISVWKVVRARAHVVV